MKINIKKILFILCMIMLTTLGVWAFSFRNMTLDFIHISDTHITKRADTSYKALSSSRELLANAIEQINNITGLDFVMFTGDMVDSATQENFLEYYKIVSKLNYPTLNAFGNHDFYGMDKEQALDVVKKYNLNYTFDKTYYAFSPKTDYRIIVLDTNFSNDTSNGKLSDEQLRFLDDELAQNQDKVVLIAMHHPCVEPFVSYDHSILNANEMNEILVKYKNPIVVISGHYHASKIRFIGNLVFVSTPSMVTYPMAFRHIKITNYKDRVQYNFEFIETGLKDIQEANKQSVISYSALYGMPNDRNITYIFNKKNSKSAKYKMDKIKKVMSSAKASKKETKKLTEPKKIKEKKVKEKKNKKQEIKSAIDE